MPVVFTAVAVTVVLEGSGLAPFVLYSKLWSPAVRFTALASVPADPSAPSAP